MTTLFILNDPPYGTERVYNGLRLAANLQRMDEGHDVVVVTQRPDGAVDDEVVPREPADEVVGIGALGMHGERRLGVEFPQPRCGHGRLCLANIRDAVERLPVQVARFDDVAVDDPDASDTGRGEVLQHRYAETAGADDEYRACAHALGRAPRSAHWRSARS